MRHRAGRRLRGQIRDEYRHRHRQIGWRYVPGIALYCAAVSVLIVWMARTTSAEAAWFAAGVGVGVAPLFLWIVLHSDEAARLEAAAMTEEWVERELSKLTSDGWVAHHNIAFADFDVDHVAIGPGGVVVIETKWSKYDLTVSNPINGRIVGKHEDQLEHGRRAIEAVLAQRGSTVASCNGLLAVGGPRRPDGPTRSLGDIRMVPVDGLVAFLRGLPPRLRPEEIIDATRALSSFEADRRLYDAARS